MKLEVILTNVRTMEIQLDQLTKIFSTEEKDIVGIENLNLEIEEGTIVGLLGPNGAGKTTTVRLLSTVYRPTSGNAYVGGYSIIDEGLKIRKIIGVATEKPSLYGRLTGRRNLSFYGKLYDLTDEQINSRTDRLAEEFDLVDAIDRPVNGYSKGMKQKLSVAKALIHEPGVLMLDEPWSGLSPVATKDLREKIKALQQEEKRTILITTHNLAQAELLVDKIIIIAQGRLITAGTPNELRDKYHVDREIFVQTTGINGFDPESIRDEISGIHTIQLDDSTITVGVEDYSVTPDIVRYLVNNNIGIRTVREIIPSLEDVYLGLVKEG